MRYLEMHIEVADLQQAETFYTRLLPHKKVFRFEDGSAVALVMEDGTAFGLWLRGKSGIFQGRGAEHLHFAFQVRPEEYETMKGRLLEMGVETFEHTWPDGKLSLYFFDADGHQGEFMAKDWLGRTS